MSERRSVVVHAIAVDLDTAAAMLAMSTDSFDRYVRPHIKVIHKGRIRSVPVAELQRWALENAENVWDGAA